MNAGHIARRMVINNQLEIDNGYDSFFLFDSTKSQKVLIRLNS